ncbi:SIR2 family protein [Vibrio fluvialis]|uniref:SIR2 family protein n=1 Tax=Vibrio fluvialis TaxID=676 RepID=UPI001302722A|nr:SIR2 family protein [Vibrio fluvialis]
MAVTTSINALDIKNRGRLSSWTLCLGAGISRGLVPMWQELAREVINRAFKVSLSEVEFESIVASAGWSLEAWIQAAENHIGASNAANDTLDRILEEVIYSDILAKADKYGVRDALIEALNNPRVLSEKDVNGLCDLFETEYSNTSLLSVTRFLIRAEEMNRLPTSIITFNADAILSAALEVFRTRRYSEKLGRFQRAPVIHYKRALNGVDGMGRGTPIIHVHGAIVPQPQKIATANRIDSRNKLIFHENQYLDVALTTSSWAQTMFTYQALVSSMVFVGLSMSDANLRRWMAAAHLNRCKELEALGRNPDGASSHLWLRQCATPKVETFQEVALAHLGVRSALIPDWSSLEQGLCNLAAC